MNKIHVYLFAFLLFASPNIVSFIGGDYIMVQAFVLAIGMFLIVKRWPALKEEGILKTFLLFLALFAVYKLMTDVGAGTRQSVVQIIGAPILLLAYSLPEHCFESYKNQRIGNSLVRIFLTFYLVETILAIIERLLMTNVFGWNAMGHVILIPRTAEFRSASLIGHPLYNSLVVSIAMAFILTSPMKLKYKFSLWSLGFLSVMCFNTRAAMVLDALLLAAYLIYFVWSHRSSYLGNKTKTLMYSVLIFSAGALCVFKFNFGGRLLKMGLMDDGSAQVRVDAWSVLSYLDYGKLLFGYTDNEISYLLHRAGLWTTENFWIDQCLKFGLIFFAIYILFYLFIIRNLLKGYFSFQKVFLLSAFIGCASVNNSLSWNFFALFEFLFLLVVFNPNVVYNFFPRKYVLKEYE